MKTIWKYAIPMMNNFNLPLPVGAEILTVHPQKDIPTIWVLFDMGKECETEVRKFFIRGTGHYFEATNYKYIGTFFQSNESLVWHLFEIFEEATK